MLPQASMGDNSWQTAPEDEYLAYLERERHLFAWCLVEYGGRTQRASEQEALEVYPYEPPEDEYRGLVFHDLAWHWAMLRIFGNGYWWGHPEREEPTEAYYIEARRFDEARGHQGME